MSTSEVSQLTVDKQRRTTIPRDVLDAAGIPAGAALVARAVSPGRIVLESPSLLLQELQQWVAEGTAALNAADADAGASAPRLPMDEELIAERRAEADTEADADQAWVAARSGGEPASRKGRG